MFRRVFTPVLAIFLLIGVAAPVSAQTFTQEPRAFVAEVTRYAIDDIIKASISKDEQVQRFNSLIDQAFDMPFVSRFVAGGYWNTATDAQKTEFVSLFTEMNVITWAARFKDYDNQQITVTNLQTQQTRGGAINEVTTVIGNNTQKPIMVIWVVREGAEQPGHLGIIDVKVEGVSMLQTFRSEYQTVLKNTGSMDGLNQALRDKINTLRANDK